MGLQRGGGENYEFFVVENLGYSKWGFICEKFTTPSIITRAPIKFYY